jgi:alpha-D-ribose 1-methylphosphonate 5-triphosphate synthase subunit PhnI
VRERHEPDSEFLKAVLSETLSLSEDDSAIENLQQLISIMHTGTIADRDWAAFLLGQTDIDTFEVREALLLAATDADPMVRAEAILALANRDRQLALSFVKKELSGENVYVPIFEAAEVIADASLIDDLRCFTEPSGDRSLDEYAANALAACEGNDVARD